MRIKNDNRMGLRQLLLIPTLFYLFKIILIFIPLKKLNEMDGVYRILQSYPFVRNVYTNKRSFILSKLFPMRLH